MSGTHRAAEKRDAAELRELIRAGASVEEENEQGNAPLWTAAAGGSLEGVLALIQAGANVDRPNGFLGRTALMAAVEAEEFEVCEALIAAGASLGADSAGNTPLHYAIAGSQKTIRLLADAGCQADQKNGAGETPAARAVSRQRMIGEALGENIKLLEELGDAAASERERSALGDCVGSAPSRRGARI